MIISVNWLKKYTNIDMPIDELTTLIGARLVEIEEVNYLGDKYKDVVIAQVASCEDVPGSDHLHLCKLDDNGAVKGVERDENDHVQVVCGAPNIRKDLMVAWLPPGSTVPSTYGDTEPFVLDVRNLRGVASNGMVASAKELDLFDEHEGILELKSDNLPGTSFAHVYGFEDFLLDIENKSLTHRPDCFGIIGFAREVAAISGMAFKTPDWLKNLEADFGDKNGNIEAPKVSIDDPKLSDRYQAVVLNGVDGRAQSTLDIQMDLVRIGVRPISAIVDVTNYLMMSTGQPLHAFDYDKLAGLNDGKIDIHVRGGHRGEKLKLLDGREIELSLADIIIANGDVAVALAGAMGGLDTEIDADTKNILLESATFNLFNLRATQMRHGIFSEAITRFTKGQPAELTAPVLAEAVRMVAEYGGERASDVGEAYPNRKQPVVIRNQQHDTINGFLGTDYGMKQITDTLLNVEFEVDVESPYTVVCTPPYWRTDIHIPEDIAEEIGRLNGFDNVKPTLPTRNFTAVMTNGFDVFRNNLRDRLVRAGANEVLTYSFVHGDLIKKAEQDLTKAYRIVNAISPDLQYYRLSILPNLLDKVNMNIRQKFDEFALFEIGKVHVIDVMDKKENEVPAEFARLDAVIIKKSNKGPAYYDAKCMLQFAIGLDSLSFQPFDDNDNLSIALAPFEPKRSAVVKLGLQKIGVVGEFKTSVRRNFKLPEYAAGFSLDMDSLYNNLPSDRTDYRSISRYPSTERDFCFQVPNDTAYQQIIDAVNYSLKDVELDVVTSPVDIYQPDGGETKNITIRVKMTANDHTLTSDEIEQVVKRLVEHVVASTGATII